MLLLDILFGFRLAGWRNTLLLNAGMVIITVASLALFIKHTVEAGRSLDQRPVRRPSALDH